MINDQAKQSRQHRDSLFPVSATAGFGIRTPPSLPDRLWTGLRQRLAAPASDDGNLLDPLTQITSRTGFHSILSASTWNAPGSGMVAALFIDLDSFKNVNGVHGYRTGDAVLTGAAERLKQAQHHTDILGRNGGDEFVLILTAPERAAHALVIAEDIRESLAMPYTVGEDRLHLTASVGVAVHDRTAVTADQLLHHADIALKSAKRDGRDRSTTFDIRQAERAKELQVQTELVRGALDDGRLTMLYQPVVDNNGTTVGVEALARCRTTQGNLVAPRDFYAGAERGNLVTRLDRQAFKQSCTAAVELTAQFPGGGLYVACNFSPKSLAQSDFANWTLAEIGATGADPRQICIEITETAAFDAGPQAVGQLNELAQAGVRISLDDFGTGFSSLSHLVDLPLTEVKIDRSFVSRLHERSSHWAIARAAVDLAKALGLQVVAEGVETQPEVDEVQQLGIGYMQGWHFERELSFSSLVSHLGPTILS